MRSVGHLSEEKQARSFSAYLTQQKMENTVRNDGQGNWVIWVYSEDQLQTAEKHFADFIQNPNNPIYQHRVIAPKKPKTSSTNIINVPAYWRWYEQYRFGPLTVTLILATTIVVSASSFGENLGILQNLFITKFEASAGKIYWYPGLLEIYAGQVWRLITPIFIHFGFLHFLFNMTMLYQLGNLIERENGMAFVGGQVVIMGVLSNVAQFYISHPMFGGMSGVLYGMFGYIWIFSKYDRHCRLRLPRQLINTMLIWYAACVIGLIPNIANTAHTVGLCVGIIWGYISAMLAKRKRKPL